MSCVAEVTQVSTSRSFDRDAEGGRPDAVFSDYGRVLRNEHVAGEYWLMELAVPNGLSMAAPGQFYQMLCESPSTREPMPFLRRPMSIYLFDPQRQRLEFLYKVTGSGTKALTQYHCGDRVRLGRSARRRISASGFVETHFDRRARRRPCYLGPVGGSGA